MYKLLVTYKFNDKKSRDGFYENVVDDKIDKISQREEGCVRYEYELPESDTELILHEEWESKDAQQVHMQQPTIGFLKGYKMRFNAETIIDVLEEDAEANLSLEELISQLNENEKDRVKAIVKKILQDR